MISKSTGKRVTHSMLAAMLGVELSQTWWDTPNKAFNGETPANVWVEDYNKVYEYVMRMAEGEW
jgi:hypothetical protein